MLLKLPKMSSCKAAEPLKTEQLKHPVKLQDLQASGVRQWMRGIHGIRERRESVKGGLKDQEVTGAIPGYRELAQVLGPVASSPGIQPKLLALKAIGRREANF